MNPRLGRWCAALVALLVSGACGLDENSSPVSAPVAQQLYPNDPDINTSDTYVLFDAEVTGSTTVSFSEPITDPATGQQVTDVVLAQPPDGVFHVEAGYDAAGVLRAVVTGQWSPTLDPYAHLVSESYKFVLSNGALTVYTAAGAVIPAPTDAPDDSVPAAAQPLADFGDALLYGNVSDGVLVDSLRAPAGAPAGSSSSSVGPTVRLVEAAPASRDARSTPESG